MSIDNMLNGIRTSLSLPTESERDSSLNSLFSNESVAKAFNEWSKDHQNFVNASPAMQKIRQIVKVDFEKKENNNSVNSEQGIQQSASVTSQYVNHLFNPSLSNLENQILQSDLADFKISNQQELFDVLVLLDGYNTLDIISPDFIKDFLEKNKSFLTKYFNIFLEIMPFLTNYNDKTLISLFSLADKKGNSALHNPQVFEKAIPLLEKLKFEDIKLLLFLMNHDYAPPLYTPEVFEKAIPFLKKIKFENLKEIIFGQKIFYKNYLFFFHDIFEKAVPLLENLKFENLKEIFSFQEEESGNTLLVYPSIFKSAIPILKNLKSENLKEILLISSRTNTTPLYDDSIFKIALPLLENLEFKDFKGVLSNQNERGEIPFFSQNVFEVAIPLLQKLNPSQLKEILFIQNEEGKTIFHHSSLFEKAIPFLEKFKFEDLKEIFSIQNERNIPLYSPEIFKKTLPFLETFELDKLKEILSIQNNMGQIILYHHSIFNQAIPLIKKIKFEDLKEIFSIQNLAGKTLLHYPYSLKRNILFFEKLESQNLLKLLSIQDEEANTPLHNPQIFDVFSPLILAKNIDIQNIRNDIGMNPLDRFALSKSWVTKSKLLRPDIEIPKEEFEKRALLIKEQVSSLFEKTKDIEPHLLEEFFTINNNFYSKEIILEKLNQIVDTIITKKAWLGTPAETDKEKLHQFYSEMLVNFETIIKKLNELNHLETIAGTFSSLAKVNLEGRCADAYQREIEQAALYLEQQNNEEKTILSGEKIAENSTFYALDVHINDITQTQYDSNVHALSQLKYAAGMIPTPEPLSPFEIDVAQQMLLDSFNLNNFVNWVAIYLGSDKQQRTLVAVKEWLTLHIPENFNLYESEIKKFETYEKKLIEDTQKQLTNAGISLDLAKKVVQIIIQPQKHYLSSLSHDVSSFDELQVALLQTYAARLIKKEISLSIDNFMTSIQPVLKKFQGELKELNQEEQDSLKSEIKQIIKAQVQAPFSLAQHQVLASETEDYFRNISSLVTLKN